MQSLFPCIINANFKDGVLFKVDKSCLSCHKQCISDRNLSIGKIVKCMNGVYIIRKSSVPDVYVGLNIAINQIDEDAVMREILFEEALYKWELMEHEIIEDFNKYDLILHKIWKTLLPLVDKADYSKINSTIIDLPVKFSERIIQDVRELRAVVTGANEKINTLDLKLFSVPRKIVKYVNSNTIKPSWEIKDGGIHVSLEELKRLSRVMNSDEGKRFSLSIKDFVNKLRQDAISIKRKVFAFNEWVHDIGHYMIRLDIVLPSPSQHQMMIDDLHTFDAVLTELSLLKVELNERFGVKAFENIYPRYKDKKTYEPYKVFHRHRFCYGDKVKWLGDDVEFRRKAKFVRWVDFIAMNLYSNAIKYLRNYPGAKEVATTFIQRKEGVEIAVRSFGPVVDKPMLAKLGLVRGRRATSARAYPGLGYGLYRVRTVCNQAGYKVWFTSEPEGSVCTGFALFGAHILIPEGCFVE